MDTLFTQQSNHGIMGEGKQEDDGDDLDSISSSSSSSSFSSSNGSSNSSDFHEDATSSSSSSVDGPLYEMSSLMQQLPFKRGLSKHYQGKSQSFTSLSNVRCLEDLAKPEHNPCKKKKLKSCKSYAGGLSERISPPKTFSKTITKNKAGHGSGSGSSSTWTSSLSAAKRSHSFRPPVPPPQRSSNLFNQTPLFA